MGSLRLELLLPPWVGSRYLHCCLHLAAHLVDGSVAVVVVAYTVVAPVPVVGPGFGLLVDCTAVAAVAVAGIAVAGMAFAGIWGGLYSALCAVGKAHCGCCLSFS